MSQSFPFNSFSKAVQQQFALMHASGGVIVQVDINPDAMWDAYMNAFPEGTNLMFRERREYDCNCCKNFIRRMGNVVALTPTGMMSIWDIKTPGYHQVVADKMSKLIKSKPINDYFLTYEKRVGTPATHDSKVNGLTWNHFYLDIPKEYVTSIDNIPSQLGTKRTNQDLLARSLEQLTTDALETVLELIAGNTLYRGAEFKPAVTDFLKVKQKYDKLATNAKHHFTWSEASKVGGLSHFKNSAIGSLVVDLSEGKPLESAVKSFEYKVAPVNYKRPTALVTPSMIKDAQATIEAFGYNDSLARRFAVLTDIDINNTLFTATNKKAMNLFDDLLDEATARVNEKTLNNLEEISIEKFISGVLPTAQSIELLVENRHTNNLTTLLTAMYPDAPRLFKWNNHFSWSYNGEVADSLRERVQQLGGRVDGVLRFTHTWNYDPEHPNQSLMDLHVFMPGANQKVIMSGNDEISNNYGNSPRVGWNQRNDNTSGGVQDVDFVSEPGTSVPVENITFPNIRNMPEGVYTFKVHNCNARNPNKSGFKAEIEFGGTVYKYEYPEPVKHKQWITLATVTLKNGVFTIDHKLAQTSQSKEVWGIKTNTWVKVNTIMNSPNHWDGQSVGNKHFFFMLDNCKTEDTARGFYNEFLHADLDKHRKVFELLSDKTKAKPADNQVSGLGFSDTKRDSVTVRVTGKTKRTFVIKF
jgi:hypothetical protein